MTTTYTKTVTIEHVSCGACGVVFGLEEDFYASRRRTGHDFYCPNGCKVSWSETTEDRLKRSLEDARRRAASAEGRAERIERSRRAYKGQLTKVKNRVSKGVCPCCNRTFQDLARHMETKHPDYASEAR